MSKKVSNIIPEGAKNNRPPPPPRPPEVRVIQEDYNLFKKIKDFFKTSPDKCVHTFGLTYKPREVCKPPMTINKARELHGIQPLPSGFTFVQHDSKYLDRIEEIFRQVQDVHIFAPSGRELLEYQIELIQEVLDERNK